MWFYTLCLLYNHSFDNTLSLGVNSQELGKAQNKLSKTSLLPIQKHADTCMYTQTHTQIMNCLLWLLSITSNNELSDYLFLN